MLYDITINTPIQIWLLMTWTSHIISSLVTQWFKIKQKPLRGSAYRVHSCGDQHYHSQHQQNCHQQHAIMLPTGITTGNEAALFAVLPILFFLPFSK